VSLIFQTALAVTRCIVTKVFAHRQKGVSVFVLADMAGHRSIQTTQRYVTVNDEMKRNAAELI
jgi:integrase/recombinase XerD